MQRQRRIWGVLLALAFLSVATTPSRAQDDAEIIITGDGGGLVDSVSALTTALLNAGVDAENIITISPGGTWTGTPFAIYYMGGTYPDNTPISTDVGQAIKDAIIAGTNAYVTGGDIWGFDAATAFNDVDGVAESGVADGDDSCTSQSAVAGEIFDPSGTGTYTQDQAGSDWTDQLAVGTGDQLGSDAAAILNGPSYITAIRYTTSGSAGNVISQSTEFGGFPSGSQDAVFAAIATYFGGLPAEQTFIRSDANADGIVDLSDGVHILDYLLTATPPEITCLDAADSNADLTVDISDAVHLLYSLFVVGAPPLIEPYPDCGEAAGDHIGCDSFAPCPLP